MPSALCSLDLLVPRSTCRLSPFVWLDLTQVVRRIIFELPPPFFTPWIGLPICCPVFSRSFPSFECLRLDVVSHHPLGLFDVSPLSRLLGYAVAMLSPEGNVEAASSSLSPCRTRHCELFGWGLSHMRNDSKTPILSSRHTKALEQSIFWVNAISEEACLVPMPY